MCTLYIKEKQPKNDFFCQAKSNSEMMLTPIEPS